MLVDCAQKDMIEQQSLTRDRASFHYASSSTYNSRDRNVFFLLVRREICNKGKDAPKKMWGAVSQCYTDTKRGLTSWAESESLKHLTAKYSPLIPPPRSTIAAAFSPDGKSLASTHGDHTVKIVDCRTGNCLKVLNGHRRTPWVVRFNPMHPDILASGSLDFEVRLWDAKTAECIGRRDFYRPIASIAFHAAGDILAVASGHKLYIWHYNKTGESSSPTIILKTRRSLRAVHFHPHAAPFLLTAEVNDLNSSDSPMTRATSPGYLRYPPPTAFVANVQSSERDHSELDMNVQVEPSSSMHYDREANSEEEYGTLVSPTDVYPSASCNSYHFFSGFPEASEDMMDTDEAVPGQEVVNISAVLAGQITSARTDSNEFVQNYSPIQSRDHTRWELTFLQGWLMGQSQAGFPSMLQMNANTEANSLPSPAETPGRTTSRFRGTSRSRYYVPEESRAPPSTQSESADGQPILNRIQSEIATSLAAPTTAELPCTVKLRVWTYDIQYPCSPFGADRCRLTIPHAVLCSEMGAHFSPCGRYLAACVACMLPNMDCDPGLLLAQPTQDNVATSPTRHPISAHQVMYELRIYSLEEATFGTVLVSRAIRAAHCLTSIQFSPTSEHILLAYGRRHGSLLKSIVINGETTSLIYTVLEVYRVSDMELVKILPSAEDEVNVACFHPFPGGGLVYGTKEGKLRLLQLNGCHNHNPTQHFSFNNLPQVQSYALRR